MKYGIPLKSPYGYDVKAESDRCSTVTVGESLTIQSMADDVDLNVIMKRFGVTGRMPENPRGLFYGDFDDVMDFRTAQEAVLNARMAFDALTPEIRERFSHNPQKFLEFCENADNLDEMRKMGLAIPKKESTVTPTPPVEAK